MRTRIFFPLASEAGGIKMSGAFVQEFFFLWNICWWHKPVSNDYMFLIEAVKNGKYLRHFPLRGVVSSAIKLLLAKKKGIFGPKHCFKPFLVFLKMKNGKLTHRLSWAIYYFRNKKQKDDKENTSQCIGYCFPPKRVLRGGWANTFWETTHSEEHSPSDVWSCFPSKYQTYLPGVISVFWDFKQISSPTDNPKKIEKTLSTSQHLKCGNYLFRLVGLGTGVICQVLIHPVPSILGHRVKDISIHPEIFPSSTFTFSGLYFGWPFLLILFNTLSIFL